MTRLLISAVSLAALLAGPAGAARFEAGSILIEDYTGGVEIVSVAESEEIEVVIRQGKQHQPVSVSAKDGVVIVKGERWKEEETKDCCNDRIRRTFDARHQRKLSTGEPLDEGFFADYPVIQVTVPRDADVSFIDARMILKMDAIDGALNLDACYVYGETGNVGEAVIGIIAGSRLVTGDVGAGLEIDVSGDADLRVGDASMVDVDIAGPGDVILGEIDGMLDVSIAGSGVVRVQRLEGPMTTRIAGSGFVGVRTGKADRLKAMIDGSGAVVFEGAVVQPDLKLYGSSEVRMGSVTGRITRAGGGEVYVANELVEKK